MIVADAELCRKVGIKNFKDIRNRSSPSPATGSPLLQNGLFLLRYRTPFSRIYIMLVFWSVVGEDGPYREGQPSQ